MRRIFILLLAAALSACSTNSNHVEETPSPSVSTEQEQPQTLPSPWPAEVQVPAGWEIRTSSEVGDGKLMIFVSPTEGLSKTDAAVAVDAILIQNGFQQVSTEDSSGIIHTDYANSDYQLGVEVDGTSRIRVTLYLVPQ